MPKSIFIIFSDYTFETNKASEKLRLAVGLTLNDENILNLVFLGNSCHVLQELDKSKANMKPAFKHVKMLAELDAKFYVEDAGNFSISNNIKYQSIKPPEFIDLLDKANVVIH